MGDKLKQQLKQEISQEYKLNNYKQDFKYCVVSVSGGLSSAEAWRRCLNVWDKDKVFPIFADVGSIYDEDGDKVSGEDDDLFRFLQELEQFFNHSIIRLKNPKYSDIWDVYFKERMLGSSLRDPCSRYMKRRVIYDYLDQNFNSNQTCIALGFSHLEHDRAKKYTKAVKPWQPVFPLMEKPFQNSSEIAQYFESYGIARPRQYIEGASHANCSSFCCKMGLWNAYFLWKTRPKVFWYASKMEEKFRQEINAKATIMRKYDNSAKKMLPITLKQLAEQFENGVLPRKYESKDCGGLCMMPQEDG